jgi:hypothetical protein
MKISTLMPSLERWSIWGWLCRMYHKIARELNENFWSVSFCCADIWIISLKCRISQAHINSTEKSMVDASPKLRGHLDNFVSACLWKVWPLELSICLRPVNNRQRFTEARLHTSEDAIQSDELNFRNAVKVDPDCNMSYSIIVWLISHQYCLSFQLFGPSQTIDQHKKDDGAIWSISDRPVPV